MAQWYELRVAGSPGTTTGDAGIKEGIAISESGRLCTISSGNAMHFETEQDAFNYLVRQTTPGRYRFEAVPCSSPTASRKITAYRPGRSPA
jgi:hypothetical protein